MKSKMILTLGLVTLAPGAYANIHTECLAETGSRYTAAYSECLIRKQMDQTPGSDNGGSVVLNSDFIGTDLSFSVVPNVTPSISGNVINQYNDVLNNGVVKSNGALVSQYGFLQLNATGDFTYTLYDKAPSVTNLKVGDVATDTFSYTVYDNTGRTVSAQLTFHIIGNPVDPDGETILPVDEDQVYDLADVDIEFNDRAEQATVLTSARMIKGHLHDLTDQDWYILPSNGNEIISLEICPQESKCYNKKRWVLYVFDADWYSSSTNYSNQYNLHRWVDETGTTKDLVGNDIITDVSYSPDSLYLDYRAGLFSNSLIGIIDPCFDTYNKVQIGVPNQVKNYYIAISSPLHGDADLLDRDENTSAGECGQGNLIFTEPGLNASGQTQDAEGNIFPKSYATTQEYISYYYSDDQYTIKVTGTGLHPLLSEQAQVKAATYNFNSGLLSLPRIRVGEQVYTAEATTATAVDGSLELILAQITQLDPESLVDAYQAIYNEENGQIVIPVVTETSTGNSYSVICQFHPATDGHEAWLEIVSTDQIQ